jgi:hypothetical protein
MKYAWAVFRNLIVLGIAIAIFYKADSDYEKIVFSLLVMIYVGTSWSMVYQNMMYFESLLAMGKEFWTIRKILMEKSNSDAKLAMETKCEEETIRTEKMMKEIRVRAYIEGVLVSIIFVITLLNLLKGLI